MPAKNADIMPSRAVVYFFALTFLISWPLLGLFIFSPVQASRWFGEISGSHPFFFLATWAPAIAAFMLVYFYSGMVGMRHFLSRILHWRVSSQWAALILIGLPLVFVAGSLFKGGPLLSPLPPEGIGTVFAGALIMLFLGPVEEFGWRGVAQPLLQRHMAPLWAGLLIGTFWGVWHLPAFFLAGTVFGDWSFLPFFIGNLAIAVLMAALLNHTGGGLLWPMLFHWQLINPFWPDAQPWDTWILAGIAVIVVIWNRDTMLTRAAAVTRVIPDPASRQPGMEK